MVARPGLAPRAARPRRPRRPVPPALPAPAAVGRCARRWTSIGMSSRTGPGRPATANSKRVRQARRHLLGRVHAPRRLRDRLAIETMSVSWKPSWRMPRSPLSSLRLTCPVMKTAGASRSSTRRCRSAGWSRRGRLSPGDPGDAGDRTGRAGGERGGLLVMHAHDAGRAEPVERVEQPGDHAAGHLEDGRHAPAGEELCDVVGDHDAPHRAYSRSHSTVPGGPRPAATFGSQPVSSSRLRRLRSDAPPHAALAEPDSARDR